MTDQELQELIKAKEILDRRRAKDRERHKRTRKQSRGIAIRVEVGFYEELKAYSSKVGISIRQLVFKAIEEYING